MSEKAVQEVWMVYNVEFVAFCHLTSLFQYFKSLNLCPKKQRQYTLLEN